MSVTLSLPWIYCKLVSGAHSIIYKNPGAGTTVLKKEFVIFQTQSKPGWGQSVAKSVEEVIFSVTGINRSQ